MNGLINFGIEKSEFLATVCEKRVHLIRRALDPAVFGWSDLNAALHAVDARAPFVRLYQDGPVSEDQFVESSKDVGLARRRVMKPKLYEKLREGGTLVMNRMERCSEVIQRLCAEVAQFNQTEALANGYLAFTGNGTFGRHWDTHDVMAVQLIGRKHWKVYRPTFELPISGQTSKNVKDECPTEPVFDGVLEAGDLLYVPRGWWHVAMPIGETFHVAIGIHAANVLHFLHWLSENVLHEQLVFRQSIRPGAESRLSVEEAAEKLVFAMRDPKLLARFSGLLPCASVESAQAFALQQIGDFALVDSKKQAIEGLASA